MKRIIAIHDQQRYDAAGIQIASIEGDHVLITFSDGGYIESWGEHGPRDFDQYGFRLVWPNEIPE